MATFTENKGQWPEQVLYRALVPGGALFVERNALTFTLASGGPMDQHGHEAREPEEPLRRHAFRIELEGARPARSEGFNTQTRYENFFLGGDPVHWGSHCRVFGEVYLHEVYPGIDLRIDGSAGLKYEFIVAPGADPSLIRLKFQGQDRLALENGRLIVSTTAGTITDEAPRCWQDGVGRSNVRSSFLLKDDQARFELERFDRTRSLTIDPEFTFGSYTGSTADNFGFTATYDNDGALYGGGIVFDLGYPVTLGVLQDQIAGGSIDIGLSKWIPDGTDLEWSTYLGGTGNETPHSLIVNAANELFLLAVTGSSDFPTTSGCYDPFFAGGSTIPVNAGFVNLQGGEGYGFQNGTDIAVVHFSSDATSLIGSTFVGGSDNDGLNQSTELVHNYGDHFRGEITLDGQGRPVVATSTQSLDMPVTGGGAQSTYGGGELDAFLFRLNASLTNLEMATYCGGQNGDSGFGVQLSSTGTIYLTGATASADLPMVGAPAMNAYGGANDGYIMRYSAAGQLLSSTFVGTNAFDECFFVQLNTANEVFVVGQTHGNYPVTPGKYSVAGSSQFIHKFSTDLSASLWSTRIGNGNGDEDISPSAFLVSDCGQIYFSGWGGFVNQYVLADQSTTTGLPVTNDAFQPNTDGSDFYLMVLDPEASGLNYATFFGGSSGEHVDGGTSRFDKNGNVYQAVCAGCGGSDNFPTTPGAWSNTNNSTNCNLGVFKFNLSKSIAIIDIDGPDVVCAPITVQFTNNSNGGNTYHWTFGDGDSSSAFEPEHEYTDAGTYTVALILTDSVGCTIGDTTEIQIEVFESNDVVIDPIDPICPGDSVELHASGGTDYLWTPSAYLSDTTTAETTAEPPATTTYTVHVTDVCGTDSASVQVTLSFPQAHADGDSIICNGQAGQLTASGGTSYLWSPGASLSSASIASPLASPDTTTTYTVTVTTAQGCSAQDSIRVVVVNELPADSSADLSICLGTSVELRPGTADTYQWTAAPDIVDVHAAQQTVSPEQTTIYQVTASNACGPTSTTFQVEVQRVVADAWPDTVLCGGASLQLFASGGTAYNWSPATGLSSASSASPVCTVHDETRYVVTASNALGCTDTASIVVGVFTPSPVEAGPNVTIEYGDSIQLHAVGAGTLVWAYDATLGCDSCASPFAVPEHTTQYTVELIDEHGCRTRDIVTVFVEGSLYVPNTFTPDGDGVNDAFVALATEVKDYRLLVFNRWGEEIFGTNSIAQAWDGSYHGVASPIDTYVWRIDFTELSGKKRTVFGHVNLVR